MDEFVKAYMKDEPQPKLHNILDPVVKEFKKLLDENKEDAVGFKKTLRRYQNIYSFLISINAFQ